MFREDIVLDESFVSVRTEETESGSDEEVAPIVNRRKKNRKYNGEETVRSREELKKLAKENGWHSKGATVKDDGTVIHSFVCKYRRRVGSGEKCKARMRCEEVSGKFTVRVDGEHGQHPEAKRRLPEGLKDEVKRLLNELPSITAQVILRSVQTRFPTTTLRQIQGVLSDVKGRNPDNTRWSQFIAEIEELVEGWNRSDKVASDGDKVKLLLKARRDDITNNCVKDFVVMLSTEKLMTELSSRENLVLDATYRVLKSGNCLLPFGFIDAKRSFVCCGFTIAKSESIFTFTNILQALKENHVRPSTIMADGITGLDSAIHEVYGDEVKRNMCAFHVLLNIKKHIKSLPTQMQADVVHDIRMAQKAETEEEFTKLGQLLMAKWTQMNPIIPTVVAPYFDKTSSDQRWRWFEGCSMFGSTNNAIESFNGHFKQNVTMRQRLCLIDMVQRLSGYLSSKSFELANNPPPTIPPVTPEDLKKAYDMKCANRPTCSYSNGSVFIMASDTLETTSKQDMLSMHLKLEKGEFDDLESYRTLKEGVYKLRREDGFYSCSCPHGQKSVNQCKHAILVYHKVNLMAFPSSARDPHMVQSARRGRTRTARRGGALSQH